MKRRVFLCSLGLSTLAVTGCCRGDSRATVEVPDARSGAGESREDLATLPKGPRVVIVRDDSWKSEPTVESLGMGLAAGIVRLTGASQPAEAWQSLFRPTENVAVKVNCLAGPALSSSPALATAVTKELVAAGHERGRLWVYDRQSSELAACGYERCGGGDEVKCLGTDEVGYDDEVTVTGEVGTWFSLIVSQWADALINVPVAKDHDMSGISGALKNHFGSISNPNKLHFPDISRAIADVCATPVLADKQRLVVYDALRVCYDGGPAFKPATTTAYGAILLATDAVAADTTVVRIIDRLRAGAGLEPLAKSHAPPTHLRIAADAFHGLGCCDPTGIELIEVRV